MASPSNRREDAERFIEEVRGHEAEVLQHSHSPSLPVPKAQSSHVPS